MKILFLSGWFPYPPNNGSKLRIYNLLRGLAEHHEISLLSFTDEVDIDLTDCNLRKLCRDIKVVPKRAFNQKSFRAGVGYFSFMPRSIVDTFSQEMVDCIQKAIQKEDFDMVIASQIETAAYRQYLNGLPALFEEVEIGILYERYSQAVLPWHRLRHGLTWLKYRRYLRQLLPKFSACTVVSEQERQMLAQSTHYEPIEVIPNCVHLADYADVAEKVQPNTLIFTGSFSYLPNYEAMFWFLHDIYPQVQQQIPDVCLQITGNHGNRPLPTTKNVYLTGYVDDVRPLIARSWASIVPLRTGGGTRLKILEAMALGTPVIATAKGAQGIEAEPGKHLLIADTPQAFAEAIIELLQSPSLCQQLAANAYNLIQEKYDWVKVMPRFLNLVEHIAHPKPLL